jgi:hypothetical protein
MEMMVGKWRRKTKGARIRVTRSLKGIDWLPFTNVYIRQLSNVFFLFFRGRRRRKYLLLNKKKQRSGFG